MSSSRTEDPGSKYDPPPHVPVALVVADDGDTLAATRDLAEDQGIEVRSVTTFDEAAEHLSEGAPYALVILEQELPDGKGTDLLEAVPEETEVVFVTGNASVDSAVAALREGAVDYLTKPVDAKRLKKILKGVKRTAALQNRVSELSRELRSLGRFDKMVGSSPVMQRVYDLIERVGPTDTTVLIIGETGTGKELVAGALHRASKRKNEPFIAINCGAIAPNIMESELFGHEKGSFTGADKRHRGVFERAHGGTLFLDEVTEMSPDLQVKLLRVLETMRVMRVGGDRPIDVDVRIVAATNTVPEEAVTEGKLREDLHFRLAVFPITLPPLRQRGEDIRILAQHFVDTLNREGDGKKVLDSQAIEVLERSPWPGNVRELANVIERAYIMADRVIDADILDLVTVPEKPPAASDPDAQAAAGLTIAEVERRHILATLNRFDGDKKQAAKALGISLKTLYNRLKKYRNT